MPYLRILSTLLESIPGSAGTGFVDQEGETVQMVGELDNYAHRVHLACQGILLEQARKLHASEEIASVICIHENLVWIICPLLHGYCLVLTLRNKRRISQAMRHLKEAARQINADL